VYIPADQLKVLFGSSSQGVLMPRDKILALWQKAQGHVQAQSVPPADTVLAQATYEARLDDHQLRVSGCIQIAKLRGDWQTVDLPFGGLAIESAQLGGEPARFGLRDDGALFLVLKKEDRVELELEMSAPLASKGGDLAATLKLPPVPASEILIRLDEGKQLQVGETTLQSDSTDNGQQTFRVAVDQTGLVPLVISDRFAGGNRAPLVFVNSRSTGHIEPAGLRWQVIVDLDVYARATNTFELELPGSVDVAEVEAPQLDAWTIREPADGTTSVSLTFRKPVLGRRTVRLLGLAPVPLDTQWDVPTVRVLQVASHVGQVLLYPSRSLRIDVGTLAGIRPERLSLPSRDAVTPLAFAFWDETFKLPLRVTPRRRKLQVSVATLVEVNRAGLLLRSSLAVQPRHAPLFGVQMQLPRDWEVISVLSADKPVEWELVQPVGSDPAADAVRQTVRFDFVKPLSPGQSVGIVLTAERHPDDWLERDDGFSETPLPELRLAGAEDVEGTVLVQAPPDIELLVSDLSDDLQPVAAERSRSTSAQAPGTSLQYRYQDDALVAGRLQIRPKSAKVSAETLAFVRLDRGKLDVHYQLDLHIRHGKIRQIQFTLPEAVGEKIQIVPIDSAARVIEQQHTLLPEAASDASLGRTDLQVRPSDADGPGDPSYLWQIVLDRPVAGDLTLAVDFGQTFSTEAASDGTAGPRGSAASGESVSAKAGTAVAIPVLALQNVSRQGGILALEAASDQQIEYEPEHLRDLDPADVLKPKAYVPTQRIVAAYQYQRLPYRLTISATRHASESVLNAICESVEIISVAGRQGRMRHQARFWLRSLNIQHLPVTLPDNADLWTVMLDSQPVEVRQKQGTYIVPLPAGQADAANDARDLTLLYETESPRLATRGLWGRLWPQTIRQSAPEIAMTTLGTTWYVHPPDGTDLVSSGGDFEPVKRLTRPTLVTRLAEAIAHQSTHALGWKLGGLVIAFVMSGIFSLVRTGKKTHRFTLVELLVVIAIIGILIALLLPATQSAREAARRSQCTNNLKQIGLALHNYHDVYGQFPPAAIGPHNVPRDRQFSWIVAVLPFLEQQGVYDALRLDLPWDHPHNAAVLQVSSNTLFCPSDPVHAATQEGLPKTSYVAITGADSTLGSGSTRGVLGFDRGLGLADITDGTSNTVMVAEVTDGGPWFAGGAGTARRIDNWIGKDTWSHHPGGGVFLLADGSVQFFGTNTDTQTLRHMATAQGMDEIVEGDTEAEAVRGPAPVGDRQAAPPASQAEEEEEPARFALPSATPQDKPSPQVRRQPSIQRGERARLSLRLALETRGERAIRFRREGGPGELVLGLQDRTCAQTLQWFIVAALLLAAWIWRRAPGPWHSMAVVVGLAVPIGLSGLVPLAWTPLLDGLLLGALAAGFLWALLRIIAAIKMRLPVSTAAAMAIGINLLFATDTSAAGEPRVVEETPAPIEQVRQRDLTIFIPYDPDSGNPLQNTQVYLPHDQFRRLWKQAHPEVPDDVPPDIRAIVSYAEYSGELHNDVARFDGRLLIHHLDDQWVPVVLPLGRVALEKIEINGHPATLADEDPAAKVGRAFLPVTDQTGKSASPTSVVLNMFRKEKGDGANLPERPGGCFAQISPVPFFVARFRQHDASEPTQSRQEISPTADGQPVIYVQEPGLLVVDVRFSVPVSRLGATGQMTVPLRPVSSGRLIFQLPADDLDVQVSGCAGGWRRHAPAPDDPGTAEGVAAAEPTGELVSVPLGTNNELSIRWQPQRVEARAGQLVNVDQALLIELLDSGVHLHSKFHYRIQQGTLSQLQLRIPPDVAVQRVHGPDVADWSIETEPDSDPNPGAQRLLVSLKTALTTDTNVDIHCFRRDRQVTGAIDIQTLEPLGVVRETGRIAIGCSSHFRVRVGQTNRVDQIDRMGLDLPQRSDDGCALLSAYRYTSRPWRLQLQVERHRPRVEVTDRTVVAVTARRVRLQSLLTADVTGAPTASFSLRLPVSLRVSQVRVPPGAVWYLDRDDTGQQLKVELNEPADGKLNLAVSGSMVRDSSQAEFVVPGITVENVQAQTGQVAIYLDDDLQAVLAGDGGARPIDPAALDSVLRPDGSRPVRYAFQYESPPEDLRLRLSSAASRLNADVTTVVSVREGAVAYISKADFEIRQAGRRRFQVVTPEWLGDDIELEGEQVRQIRSRVTDDGRTWDIELQQPVRGTYRLQMTQTLPLSDDGTVPAAIIRPLDVERLRTHIILENLTADEIVATTASGAATISIGAVPDGLTEDIRRRAVAAYRIVDDAAVLVWQRRVREQEAGLVASINLADLATVVHADGRYRARAAYHIRNFTLQFLELELPSDSRVWSVRVSGQPVRPAKIRRQGRPITLLPLEKTSAGDFSSKVIVVYSGHLGEPLRRWTQVRPPAPRILSDVPVSRTLWTILLPREYKVRLVKRKSNLEEVAAAYQQEERKLSFLDELRQMVQVASTKGKSGARTKARDNLKQIGSALQGYAEQSAQVDATIAADVQEQAQQIEAEIRRLDELKTEAKRADTDTDFYFKQPQQRPEGVQMGIDPDWGFEELPDLDTMDADEAAPEDVREKPEDQDRDRGEQGRGKLREQAAEQLEKLQTSRQEERSQEEAAPQQPSELPDGQQEAGTDAPAPSMDERTGEQAPQDGQAASGPPVAAARSDLSLDLDLALVGTAYHFRKLQGEPRLVLRARHENLGRFLIAVLWGGLCLALAAVAVYGLRRPNAAALAYRGWPWLAVVTGTVWLFLLPLGVIGLALLVTGLGVLIARSRKPQTTDSAVNSRRPVREPQS
jgi:hypothetical protein